MSITSIKFKFIWEKHFSRHRNAHEQVTSCPNANYKSWKKTDTTGWNAFHIVQLHWRLVGLNVTLEELCTHWQSEKRSRMMCSQERSQSIISVYELHTDFYAFGCSNGMATTCIQHCFNKGSIRVKFFCYFTVGRSHNNLEVITSPTSKRTTCYTTESHSQSSECVQCHTDKMNAVDSAARKAWNIHSEVLANWLICIWVRIQYMTFTILHSANWRA